MRRQFLFLIVLAIAVGLPKACTVCVVDGMITEDGRPILAKVRHPADPSVRNRVWRTTVNGRYWYISVDSAMGVNETGFAAANTAASDYSEGCSSPVGSYIPSFPSLPDFTNWAYDPATEMISGPEYLINVLGGCATVDQARNHLQNLFMSNKSEILGLFSMLDASGYTSLFEVCLNSWWSEYPTLHPNRTIQNTYGFCVRETAWQYRFDGTDNINVTGDRYETGRVNLQGMLAEKGHISLRLLAHGTAGPDTGYEYYRYGPNRPLAPISDPRNRSCIIVHGVLPNEDPMLVTMWVGIGQADYTVLVPTWVMIRNVPDSIGAGLNGHMFDRSVSLFNKGNELITQQSTYPFEEHIFNEVIDGLLPHWRTFGTPSRDTMERVCQRIAADAYSLLHCLDLTRYDNKAPNVDFDILPDGMTLHFTLKACDPDGEISSVLWNFGDNTSSTLSSPSHTFMAAGDYLISCTVTDNEGVSNTQWIYFTVPFTGDLTGDSSVELDELIFLAQRWLNACAEPLWCDGADFNRSGKVDLADMMIFSNCWVGQ